MNTKTVQFVIAPQQKHWVGDGFNVNNFIPSMPGLTMKDMDPFILLDYNQPMNVFPSSAVKGVGAHPHRGFETVTLAVQGMVEHHDSHGGGGVIGEGEVQWMTAASGVLHKEYYAKEWAKNGGTFQMVQLWVNLPAKDKMKKPAYQTISKEQMVKFSLGEDSYIDVVAGKYKDVIEKATTHSDVRMFKAVLKTGVSASFTLPQSHNTAILVLKGNVFINEETLVNTHNLAKFNHDGETFSLKAQNDAEILVISGEPLNEPITAYGPFVMNTKQEILQAYNDFEEGKFGILED